ncbi:flavin reductase family protein [Nocardioides marmotae]|uniref:flavin reductase family protein n=1 Tax=Nocardioides marmotae TaxID=2663857 RepID=UPI0012B59A58|nr:flavin reductase family protein [Nocardioides marmotae]MBC9732879.1 flavin reductase family protein [Nocardioides marmotae]MTB83993.1 flavin reductase [Nocardioides marmotae]
MSEATVAAVIDPARFRDTLGHYPTGVALVTAMVPGDSGADEPVGMVVGSFVSVSLDPPLVAFLPDRESRTFARLRRAETFCVNVLAADQADLVGRWRGTESFADLGWSLSPAGNPVLPEAVTWIDCGYHDLVEAGDHYIVLGDVRSLEVQRPTSPLLFFQGGFGGFAPPSFLAPPEHDLIRAARISEVALAPLAALAAGAQADVSLLALVGDHDVVIATERGSATPSYLEIGLRLPAVPPSGSVHLEPGDDAAMEAWLARLPRTDEASRERCAQLARRVAEQGYSLSLVGEGPAQDVWQDVTRYIHGDPTPRRQRQVLAMHLDHLDYYEPELEAGASYDVRSITAAVPLGGTPRMAVRLTFPPAGADAATVARWGAEVRERAAEVADLVHARFGENRDLG